MSSVRKETEWERRTRRVRERDELIGRFGNRCMICGSEPKSRALHVDHNHATGRNRGLLCYRCNKWLPAFITVGWLLKAAQYLSHPPADVMYLEQEMRAARAAQRRQAP